MKVNIWRVIVKKKAAPTMSINLWAHSQPMEGSTRGTWQDLPAFTNIIPTDIGRWFKKNQHTAGKKRDTMQKCAVHGTRESRRCTAAQAWHVLIRRQDFARAAGLFHQIEENGNLCERLLLARPSELHASKATSDECRFLGDEDTDK